MSTAIVTLGSRTRRPRARARRLYPPRVWAVILAVVRDRWWSPSRRSTWLVPASSPLYLSDYTVTLVGKILCYATVALAMDLVWGYTGILSLGHGLFFALGGYAMGMYLMRAIGRDGVYGDPVLPDFMVFLDWKELPWYWAGSDRFLQQALLVVLVPGAAGVRLRLVRLPLPDPRGLLLDHHPGADLRGDAALLPEPDRLRRKQRLHRLQAHPRLPAGQPADPGGCCWCSRRRCSSRS